MALALVAVMMMALMLPAFAADNYTLTINNTVKDHTYTAYQIFKGSRAEDATQVSYTPVADDAEFDATATYYVKNGADYDVATSLTEFEADTTYYTRTGDSALGDVIWGADITAAGKKALYAAYEMTVADADLDKTENIKTLIDKIADVDNTTDSESDKAVKFANVFFETVAQTGDDGAGSGNNVQAKEGLLQGPTGGKKITATGNTVTFDNLASGYYLVNDSYSETGKVNGIDYSIARIAVQVVGDTTINNKADKPTVEKKIKTADDLYNEKANELGIGRTVEYEVTEAVPNYDGYNYYYFNLRDTLSTGLTFDADSVVVKIGGETLKKLTAPATSTNGKGYYLYADKTADSAVLDGATFVIAFEDIMKFDVSATITVTYNASVNSNAITGIDPNTNKVVAEYSNDPTKSGKGDIDNNHPGVPANDDNHPKGTTPGSYTDTYTTKLTIHKVDENGDPLENVEFTLTGVSKDVILQNETTYELDSTGTYYMLKDGTYTTDAPQSEATLQPTTGNSGWIKIDANETYTGSDVRVVNGEKYRPFVVETDQNKTHYIIVEGNVADYASTTLKYKPVEHTSVASAENYNVVRVGKTGSDGNLEFAQLGAGTYTLSETVVLPGYNDISDISFKIEFTEPEEDTVIQGIEQCEWTVTDISPNTAVITEVEDNDDNGLGIFEITIQNNKGTQLPSTGGIGTTIFYIVGAVLVVGAGVLLVTRRRMRAE